MLKTIRERAGITQAQLAEGVGVTVRAVRKWETAGIRHASLGNAERAASALGCEVADLLREPDGKQKDERR